MTFQLWGESQVDLLASLHTNHGQQYYTLENLLPLAAWGFNSVNYSWMFQVTYIFPPPIVIPLFLSKILPEHATGQCRLSILSAPSCIGAYWLPRVLNILEDVPHWCPNLRDLIRDAFVS